MKTLALGFFKTNGCFKPLKSLQRLDIAPVQLLYRMLSNPLLQHPIAAHTPMCCKTLRLGKPCICRIKSSVRPSSLANLYCERTCYACTGSIISNDWQSTCHCLKYHIPKSFYLAGKHKYISTCVGFRQCLPA